MQILHLSSLECCSIGKLSMLVLVGCQKSCKSTVVSHSLLLSSCWVQSCGRRARLRRPAVPRKQTEPTPHNLYLGERIILAKFRALSRSPTYCLSGCRWFCHGKGSVVEMKRRKVSREWLLGIVVLWVFNLKMKQSEVVVCLCNEGLIIRAHVLLTLKILSRDCAELV